MQIHLGRSHSGLHEWQFHPTTPAVAYLHQTTTPPWHHRLGHPSTQIMQKLISFIPNLSNCFSTTCNSCNINKSHRLPFSTSTLQSSSPSELIYSHVWSSHITSFDGYRYYIIFIDHFTRYTWIYFLKNKSDSLSTFIRYKQLVENYFNCSIKCLYLDDGGEYVKLDNFVANSGILHLTSPPHTPQHYEISERKHRYIIETRLTLLTHAPMPIIYWPFAFTTATYLIKGNYQWYL